MGNVDNRLQQGLDAGFAEVFGTQQQPTRSATFARNSHAAQRQPELLSEYRCQREHLLAAFEHVTDELRAGRAAPLMGALFGLYNPEGVGRAVIELMRDRLVDQAREAAEAEAEKLHPLEGGAA